MDTPVDGTVHQPPNALPYFFFSVWELPPGFASQLSTSTEIPADSQFTAYYQWSWLNMEHRYQNVEREFTLSFHDCRSSLQLPTGID